MRLRALAVVSMLAAAACTRPDPPSPPLTSGTPECVGSFSVVVSSGVTPRFTWVPDCTIRSLAVQTADERHTNLWVINMPEPYGIRSGVTYGETPAGATLTVAPRRLRAGEPYMATVRNVRRGTSIVAEAVTAFRP